MEPPFSASRSGQRWVDNIKTQQNKKPEGKSETRLAQGSQHLCLLSGTLHFTFSHQRFYTPVSQSPTLDKKKKKSMIKKQRVKERTFPFSHSHFLLVMIPVHKLYQGFPQELFFRVSPFPTAASGSDLSLTEPPQGSRVTQRCLYRTTEPEHP